LFNLKITDISELSNPFVIFENRPVNQDGYLYLSEKCENSKESVSPCSLFGWLKKPSDIEHRTFKIEVIFKNEPMLSRYLHMSKLFPMEYPKLALQITNNLYQNQYLLYKERKLQSLIDAAHLVTANN